MTDRSFADDVLAAYPDCNASEDTVIGITISNGAIMGMAMPDNGDWTIAGPMINHPPHYTHGKYEVIDVIEDWKLDFHLGNAVKYIARARHKGRFEEDIAKAIWYLHRAITRNMKNDS